MVMVEAVPENEKKATANSAGRRLVILVSLLLVATVAVTWRDTLHHRFVYDDFELVVKNRDIRDLSAQGLSRIFFGKDYLNFLPLRMLSYAIDYHFWKLDPFGYHLTNVILHAANSLLVFYMVLYMLAVVASPRWERAIFAAAAAAAFFALHPIHVEAVTWVSGRKDLLYSFFTLIGFYAFVRYRVRGEPVKFRGGYVVALLCLCAALISKGTAVSLPFVFLLFDLLFPGIARRTSLSQRIQEHVFFFLTMAVILGLDIKLASREDMFTGPFGGGLASHIFTIVKVVPFYLRMIFWPHPLSAVYETVVSRSIFEPVVLVSIATMAVVSALFIYWRRRAAPAAFALGWFLLMLGPTLNIVPFGTFAADRYVYLALFGICVLAGMFFGRLAGLRGPVKYAAVVILLVLFAACYQASHARNADWKDEIAFWSAAAKTQPRAAKVHVGLGMAYLREKNYEKALPELEAGRRLDPEFSTAYVGLGLYYLTLMDFKKAKEVLEEGLRRDAGDIELYYYYGMTNYNLEHYKIAVRMFFAVNQAIPGFMESNRYLRLSLKRLSEVLPSEEYQRFVDNL